ncbi:MAG TPA: HEAT repeat domain-containing protein [Longimicrobiaceae bacterium]|nr:HEAT repeat domain-containing protein [Longimicrobiaceae bacterium]
MHIATAGIALLALLAATSPSAGLQGPAAPAETPAGGGEGPPPPWSRQDPADGLYRTARAALNEGDYGRASGLFRQITARYPRSAYAPDALYWAAFSHYRMGGSDNLRAALGQLDEQRRRFPRAATRGDADVLATRIRGELARMGDAGAAVRVARDAARAAAPTGGAGSAGGQGACTGNEDDVRTAALNALLQMNTEQAVPILRQVLARRDACSAPLRKQAVFLLSQKRTAETENLLLSVARQDPDPDVREKAVFWLSQIPTERAVDVLQEILGSSRDDGVREKAIFALSQHPSARARQVLRDVAEQSSLPAALRERAIFWIGQRPSAQNASFLRALYGRLDSEQLKERTLFSLSQMQGQGNDRWLLEVVTNEREPVELRKMALFWAGQTGASVEEISGVYARISNREVREQVIFVLSQRQEAAALDRLIEIARSDRDAGLRQKAIFWLGQSKDPRAARALQDIVAGG